MPPKKRPGKTQPIVPEKKASASSLSETKANEVVSLHHSGLSSPIAQPLGHSTLQTPPDPNEAGPPTVNMMHLGENPDDQVRVGPTLSKRNVQPISLTRAATRNNFGM